MLAPNVKKGVSSRAESDIEAELNAHFVPGDAIGSLEQDRVEIE